MTMHPALALPVSAALPYGAALLGLTREMGAHPFWAISVVAIGAPVGIALAFGLRALRAPRLVSVVSFVLLAVAAFAISHLGKTAFAASYAENALAGRAWYFGWIAAATFVTAALAAALTRSRSIPE